ncbi:PH domain-containing protein [Aquisphaera insulae]|uniref:PH domain-containing protein n=1 Tax=Aquisphaera insulae TaxID=2712864 RepID=UPI0013EB99F3
MAIQLICQCGKHLSVPEQFAGRKASCKACGAALVIPSPSSAPTRPVESGSADDILYDASPAMFRNHPILFVMGSVLFVLALLMGLTAFRQADAPAWAAFLMPGLIACSFINWYLKCRNTRLTITRRKVTLRRGILSKSLNEVRITDVRNILVIQGFLQRMLGVGSLGISTSGQSGIEIDVKGIPDPGRVREIIDKFRG